MLLSVTDSVAPIDPFSFDCSSPDNFGGNMYWTHDFRSDDIHGWSQALLNDQHYDPKWSALWVKMIQNDPKWLCILCILCILCTGTSPSFTHRYSASPSPRQSPGSLAPGWLERCSAPQAALNKGEQTSTCRRVFSTFQQDLGRIVIIVILSLLSLLSLAPAAHMKPFWAPLFSDDQLTSADKCWPVLTADTQCVLQSTL